MEELKTKVFSQRSILIATFLGSPLAASYLIRQNFLAFNQPELARKALWIGIVSTIVIFSLVFIIPESSFEYIPRFIIPLAYTFIIYAIVEKYQGNRLKELAEKKDILYSSWRAAFIGLLSSLLIVLIGLSILILFNPDKEIYDLYDQQLEVFAVNEEIALEFHNNLQSETDFQLVRELSDVVIPKWEENISIFNKLKANPELTSDLREYNDLMLEYSYLRLEEANLFKKAILKQSDEFSYEFERINSEISNILSKLN